MPLRTHRVCLGCLEGFMLQDPFLSSFKGKNDREEVGNPHFRTNILMLEIFALYSHGQSLNLKVRLTCLFTSVLTRK